MMKLIKVKHPLSRIEFIRYKSHCALEKTLKYQKSDENHLGCILFSPYVCSFLFSGSVASLNNREESTYFGYVHCFKTN